MIFPDLTNYFRAMVAFTGTPITVIEVKHLRIEPSAALSHVVAVPDTPPLPVPFMVEATLAA
jgi:hypothetical protein